MEALDLSGDDTDELADQLNRHPEMGTSWKGQVLFRVELEDLPQGVAPAKRVEVSNSKKNPSYETSRQVNEKLKQTLEQWKAFIMLG